MNCTLTSRLGARRRYPILLKPIRDQANVLVQGRSFFAPPRFLFRRQRLRQCRFALRLKAGSLRRLALALQFRLLAALLFLALPLFLRLPLPFGLARGFLFRLALTLKFRQAKLLLPFLLFALLA